jgi:hypothetical protein
LNGPLNFDQLGWMLQQVLPKDAAVQEGSIYTHTFRAGRPPQLPEGVSLDFGLQVSPEGMVEAVTRIAGPEAGAQLFRDIIVAHLKDSGFEEAE